MANLNEKKKHQNAAKKAWKTIRADKRKKAAMSTEKITRYITPEQINKIKHPDLADKLPLLSNQSDWNGNRIIVPFTKTPSDIACGRFWEVRWAYGCPLNCSYCFLRGTMRGRMKPQYVRTELVLEALDEAFCRINVPTIFNSGELADSLMNPPMMEPIVNKFEEQNKHKIYLLSKFGSANVGFLTNKPRKQVICGWSINAPHIAGQWEKTAPSPLDRIEAAYLVKSAGFDTRVRLDPIFPVQNWRQHYGELVDKIFEKFTPNKVILGTPRGLWKTLEYARIANVNIDWIKFFSEDSGWGKKLAFQERKEIYEFMYDKLRSCGYNKSNISMCKETPVMWKELGLTYTYGCNCYGRS
jgi:DNA repair photolyase